MVEYLSEKFNYILSEVILTSGQISKRSFIFNSSRKRKYFISMAGRKNRLIFRFTVDELIDQQVEKTPHAIAVIDQNDHALQYCQLKEKR